MNERRYKVYASVKFFSVLLFFLSSLSLIAQSTAEVNKEAIITDARKQLVAMSAPEGELYKFVTKNNIKGEFIVDLTLVGKGKIVTVFMASSTAETIQTQNQLKSKLMEIEFSNIKIEKKERIKFRHTLTF
ncbi:hypothetical protein BH09BAC3_BH09BAC3_03500 [soil metagenome]